MKPIGVFLTTLFIFAAGGTWLFSQGVDNSPLGARRCADAAVDRNLLVPSAETTPARNWTFNSYELFLAGFTYGISDDLQVSLTGLLPIFNGQPQIVSGELKGRLIHGKGFVFSLQAGGQFMGGGDVDSKASGNLGAFLDIVADRRGDFVLSLALQGFIASHREWEYIDRYPYPYEYRVRRETRVTLLPSLGFNYRAGRRIKIFGELLLPTGEGSVYLFEGLPKLLAYGIRFFGSKIAVDLSFFRPLASDDGDFENWILGIPYLTFSVRF